ncbi:transposase, partial [Aliifodinibius sp. S!AR15-10]|uniref:IS110 family transposase n=1 Tax=Aliifodinibius sp. S!AR15-10 TaxID=2950437 RepID=UPI00286740F3
MSRLQSTKLDFTGQSIFVGLDTHKKSWKVSIYHAYGFVKSFSQDPDPQLLAKYLRRTFPGADYQVVYEAGCFGFWIQQQLQTLGITCILTHPADVPTSDKQKRRKTDRVDARKLAQELRAGRLVAIYVPSPTALADRMLVRTRAKMVKNQTRLKNQIKSLLTFLGVPIPFDATQHWSGRFMQWLAALELPDGTATVSLRAYLGLLEDTKKHLTHLTRQLRRLASSAPYQ